MLEIEDVTVRFGGVLALSEVSVRFDKAVNGIIGPNGAGKTTLMNVLSGFVRPVSGRVEGAGTPLMPLAPHRRAHWGLRRSFQKEEIADDLTVFENVLVQIDHSRSPARTKTAEVEAMLALVGMADRAGKIGAALSGFERRLTDVAKCLVGKPRLVMFDEPAGGMSVEESRQLGGLIRQIHGATGAQVLVIDHDVDLIRTICEDTLVLDFGRRIAFGPTAGVLDDPRVKAAYLGTEEV